MGLVQEMRVSRDANSMRSFPVMYGLVRVVGVGLVQGTYRVVTQIRASV